MEKLLSKMKTENKHNQTIRKEDLDIEMEHVIQWMKTVTTKYENKNDYHCLF